MSTENDEPENPWRPMKAGETVQEFDEYQAPSGDWIPVYVTIGVTLTENAASKFRTLRK